MAILTIRQLLSQITSTPQNAEIHAQCSEISPRRTKTNKTFFALKLKDSQSTLDIKIWENSPAFGFLESHVNSTPFVAISGAWKSSDYGTEADIFTIAELSDEQKKLLLSGNAQILEVQQNARNTIERLVHSISDPRLNMLCRYFLQRYGEKFYLCAAAKSFHHARRGGLCEHVAGMMAMAHATAQVYPDLNRDLLLTGALLHDVGKLWENAVEEDSFAIELNPLGELLGHIPLGLLFIQQLWSQMMKSSAAQNWTELSPKNEQIRIHLLHLIASHHGELEFGSPTLPKTPEAAALHYIDNLDAKIEMFRLAYAESTPLTDEIFSRRAPLPGNVVSPLPKFSNPS